MKSKLLISIGIFFLLSNGVVSAKGIKGGYFNPTHSQCGSSNKEMGFPTYTEVPVCKERPCPPKLPWTCRKWVSICWNLDRTGTFTATSAPEDCIPPPAGGNLPITEGPFLN